MTIIPTIDRIDALASEYADKSPNEILALALSQQGEIAISFSGAEDVVLIDMLGKALSSFENMSGLNEISLSTLSDGIYFLRCTSESGDIVTKKIIKK